jgi:TonB family protein
MYQLLSAALTAAILLNPVTVATERPASCTVPNSPASIVKSAAPEYPAGLEQIRPTGSTVVRIDLSETGAVAGAYVVTSSGNALLDQAAIRTAKSMVYSPEKQSCTAIPGSYAVEVEFAG